MSSGFIVFFDFFSIVRSVGYGVGMILAWS